jgi:hypothetical protein
MLEFGVDTQACVTGSLSDFLAIGANYQFAFDSIVGAEESFVGGGYFEFERLRVLGNCRH